MIDLPLRTTLRARILVSFIAVAVLTAVLTAGAAVLATRTVLVDQTRATAVASLRAAVQVLAPDVRLPADCSTLDYLVAQVRAGAPEGTRVAASSGDVVVAGGGADFVPSALISAARESREARTVVAGVGGADALVVAMPVLLSDSAEPSGLVVYTATPLTAQQALLGSIVTGTVLITLPVLVVSVLLGILVVTRSLRPVRRLHDGVRALATGRLGAQVAVDEPGELGELASAFNEMSRELATDRAALRTLEAKARRFAADVSHELRTPLAAMAAVSSALAADAERLPADTAEAAHLVASETRHLVALVEDLMEISRFDAGTAELRLDQVRLADLVERTLRTRDWSGRVSVHVPGNLHLAVDPRRIDVILANLIGNALRHAGPHPTVSLTARSSEGAIEIDVDDDGPGIMPDLRAVVFDRFAKGDEVRGRSEGSGLGLAIASENAALHGGSLSLVDLPSGSRGTRFRLRLPTPSTTSPAGGHA